MLEAWETLVLAYDMLGPLVKQVLNDGEPRHGSPGLGTSS